MRQHPARRRAFAASLAALAGYVDAIGVLTLGGLFVSFMSGYSTRAGVDATLDASRAVLALLLFATFVLGVIAGSFAGERAGQRRARRVLSVMAAALVAATACVALGWNIPGMLAATFAMGATNAIFAPGSGLPVGLTYMTGTLVRLGQTIASGLAGTGDRRAWQPYAVHWLALLAGALLGTFAQLAFGPVALGAGAVVFLIAAMLEMRKPVQLKPARKM